MLGLRGVGFVFVVEELGLYFGAGICAGESRMMIGLWKFILCVGVVGFMER
jgi:hypothetical protein